MARKKVINSIIGAVANLTAEFFFCFFFKLHILLFEMLAYFVFKQTNYKKLTLFSFCRTSTEWPIDLRN